MRTVYNYYSAALAWKQNSQNAEWQIKNGDVSETISYIDKIDKGEITRPLFLGYGLTDGKHD